MECSCTVETDCDEGPSFFSSRERKARKEHKCNECRRIISPGETYEYIAGVWDGSFDTYKTCSDCLSVRDEFFKSGYILSDIWMDLREYIFDCHGDIPEKCLVKLTPSAREKVLAIIERYFSDDE